MTMTDLQEPMNRLSTAIALSALSALSASAVALCVAFWSDSRRPPAQDAPRVDVEREAQELRELVASLEDELLFRAGVY